MTTHAAPQPADAPASPAPATPPELPSGPPPRRPAPNALALLARSAADVWRARGLLYELTLRDIRIRYKQAALGVLWALLTPVLVVLAGVMVRVSFAASSGHAIPPSDIAGIALKAVPWAFFSGAVSFGTGSLVANANLLTKVSFPREVLPVASVLAHLVDLAAGLAATFVLAFALGVRPSAALLWVPVLVVLLATFTTATVLVLSCANLFFRDVKYIVQVLITFGIFFTPVFFDVGMLSARAARRVMLNPLGPILEGVRVAVVERHDLLTPLATATGTLAWRPAYLAYAAAWSIGGLLVAAVAFARLKRSFADYV